MQVQVHDEQYVTFDRKAIENLEVKGDSLPEVKVPEIAKLINSVVGSDVAAKLRSFHELHPKIVLTAAVLLKKSTSTPITCAKVINTQLNYCVKTVCS